MTFRYQVVKVWELEAERLLEGGLGTLPLAPIGAVSRDDVPGVVRRMSSRLRREVEPTRAQELWSATFVLMGLRYEEDFIKDTLKGVTDMEESVTYRAIVEKGRKEGLVEEARKMVLSLGEKQIGAPSARAQAALERLELAKLEELLLRVPEVSSWEELLGLPAKGRARKR